MLIFMRHLFFVILLIALSCPAQAKETLNGPIIADVIRVIDGDTFDVRAKIWIGQYIETRVRLNGIDTPELRGKCDSEKQKAEKAKAILESLILNKSVYLDDIHGGKYAGRVIANARTDKGIDLSSQIIRQGYARKYDGGMRSGWCQS